jgi:hypothetical protein
VLLDVNSNPAVQAYRYKLTILDTCGVETNLSDFHKTIHLTINQGVGGAWNLIWSHYEGITFSSYNIYRGTAPGNIALLTSIQSNLNSYTDLAPPAGGLYYQIEVVNPNDCDPTKIADYGVSRSNIANNGLTSIEDFAEQQCAVFPNPSHADMTLVVKESLLGQGYTVRDGSGRVVFTGKITNLSQRLTLQTLSKGTYYLNVEENAQTIRLVLQ